MEAQEAILKEPFSSYFFAMFWLKKQKTFHLLKHQNKFFRKINDMASRVNWHASWIAVYVNDHGLGEYLVPLGLVSGRSTGHLVH